MKSLLWVFIVAFCDLVYLFVCSFWFFNLIQACIKLTEHGRKVHRIETELEARELLRQVVTLPKDIVKCLILYLNCKNNRNLCFGIYFSSC